ncbi:hypothetical protein Ancab_031664 [Ancistrocladus abbreviatus]
MEVDPRPLGYAVQVGENGASRYMSCGSAEFELATVDYLLQSDDSFHQSASLSVQLSNRHWLLAGVYGSLNSCLREAFWKDLSMIATASQLTRLAVGDST